MNGARALALAIVFFLALPVLAAFSMRVPARSGSESAAGNVLPIPRATWSNFTPNADSTIASAYPSQNFGAASTLELSANPTAGATSRALVSFGLGSIPSTSQILGATLRVYVENATGSTNFEAHRLLAPWVEGTGVDYRFDRTITVTETAGVPRAREPVEARIVLGTPIATNPQGDFRVFDSTGREVPSQVTQVARIGSNVTAVTVVFESSNRARQSLTYHVRYGYAFGGVPPYRQKAAWVPLWNRTIGATYSSPAIADLDGDGTLETIVGSPDGNVYATHADGSPNWTANLGAPVEAPIAVADLAGNGSLEVLAMTDGVTNHRLYAISSIGKVLWSTGANPGKAGQGPIVVADTNGDGIKEVFVGALDRYVYAFSGLNGTTLWSFNLGPGNQGYGGALANFTGGPAPELIFGTSTGTLQALTTGGLPLWSVQPGSNSMLQTPAVADINGDGLTDIVAGDRATSGSQFAVLGQNGSTEWRTSTGSDQSGGNVVVDFGHDGRLETVFAKTLSNQIGAVDANGKWLWNFTTGGSIYSTPAAAELTSDGEADIVVGSFDNNVYVIASNGTLIQKIPTDSPVRGTPAIADIDGDGVLDLVFATATHLWAYRTATLGHDSRVGSYNLRNTGHFLDGNSPDGAALLGVTVGVEQAVSGVGVTWLSRDGTNPWTVPGSEYDAAIQGSAAATAGVWVSINVTWLVQQWVANAYPNLGAVLRLSAENSAATVRLASREVGSLGPILEVQFNNDRSPHIVGRIPDQVFPENSPPWTLNLVNYASDPDTPLSNLRWDLAGVNFTLFDYAGGNVTGNMQLTFQPKSNAFGANRVTIYLFDEGNRYDSQALWVNLTHVNQPPSFTPPTAFYVRYDYPYTFNFTPYMSDVDNATWQLSLTTNDPLHTAVTKHNVTFLYPQSDLGLWQFPVLTVSDGLLRTSRTIGVLVTSDYPPELIKQLPDVTLLEGQTRKDVFDLDDYFTDPNNNTLFYSYGFTHLEITVHNTDPQPLNHTVDMTALGLWWGTESVTFRATDPTNAIIEDTILVTVIPVNHPPTIMGVPPLVVHWDAPYKFDLTPYIFDPDTPINQIQVSTSNPSNVNVSGRVLTLLYPNLGIGTYVVSLVINVSDGLGNAYERITVTVTNDYPPVLRRTLPDVIFRENTVLRDAFNLDDHFYDNDSATVYYSSGEVHVNVTINANHSVDFSADPNWYGIETVRFRATDDQGAIAEDTIKVIVEFVDLPPTIVDLGDLLESQHSWFIVMTPHLRDVDTNISLIRVTASSAAGNYVSSNGQILLFSYPDNVNADTVTITVFDDYNLSATATIHVKILGPDYVALLLPWIAAALVAAASVVVWNRVRPQVDEVFLVHANGLPIAHLSRTLKAEKDTDVVTSMFTAIQNFTNDVFRARGAGALSGLQLGDYRVTLARGSSAFLVVLYSGRLSHRLERKAQEVIEEVESKFGPVLANWSGAVDELSGVKELMEQLFKARASAVLDKQVPQQLGGRGGLGGTAAEDVVPAEEPLPPPPP